VGGVGGFFGGRLAQAGEEVALIARGDHLRAIQAAGLKVEGADGELATVRPALATADPAEVGPVDVVLVAVKAWQVSEAAAAIGPLLSEKTMVVPLQNGVSAVDQLAAEVGKAPVVGGTCALISFIDGPGQVRCKSPKALIQFGELDNRRSERVERLQQAFAPAADIQAIVPPDIQVAMWHKFVLIAGWSGVGAMTRAPLGFIRSRSESRELLKQTMAEVYQVALARGVALPPETVEKIMATLDNFPADGTASLQRDVMAGRPSELETQNGAVVSMGRAAGVETPLNRFIYHSLLLLEQQARGEINWAQA
jgi:2-dehydropantoate 2-reductase